MLPDMRILDEARYGQLYEILGKKVADELLKATEQYRGDSDRAIQECWDITYGHMVEGDPRLKESAADRANMFKL